MFCYQTHLWLISGYLERVSFHSLQCQMPDSFTSHQWRQLLNKSSTGECGASPYSHPLCSAENQWLTTSKWPSDTSAIRATAGASRRVSGIESLTRGSLSPLSVGVKVSTVTPTCDLVSSTYEAAVKKSHGLSFLPLARSFCFHSTMYICVKAFVTVCMKASKVCTLRLFPMETMEERSTTGWGLTHFT